MWLYVFFANMETVQSVENIPSSYFVDNDAILEMFKNKDSHCEPSQPAVKISDLQVIFGLKSDSIYCTAIVGVCSANMLTSQKTNFQTKNSHTS